MNKGLEVLIKVVGIKAKSSIKLQEASPSEISLALTHIEIIKLQLMQAFSKSMNVEKNDKRRF